MQPDIQLNYWAILAAVAASMVIGFLWYGPILGKAWMKEMGRPADHKRPPSHAARNDPHGDRIVPDRGDARLQRGGVAALSLKIGANASNATYGFFVPFFAWIGFCAPLLLGAVAWENRSWKLFCINAAHYFVSLQAMG